MTGIFIGIVMEIMIIQLDVMKIIMVIQLVIN